MKGTVYISNVINIIIAILVFGVLIFVHELGHFSVAKWCKIKVNQFSIGMGPALFKIQKGETLYALRLFPIGGFCAMEGEDDDSTDEHAFSHRPIWQRILVVIAGAVMNILLGFIIIVIMTSMNQYVGTTRVAQFDTKPTSNAAGGLMVNDVISSVNGSKVHICNDVIYDLILDGDNKVDMTVIRNGKAVELHNVVFPYAEDGKTLRRDFWFKAEPKSFTNVMHESYYSTVSMVRLVYMTFVELFKGRFGMGDLSGPIGTTVAVGQAASYGISDLLFIAALITVNLGVVNLFPLPALDGGRLVFLLVEAIRRKPINPKYEGYVHFAGFVLLMLLMVVVSYNDIIKLIKG